jgi:predicted nucleic acid-binding protein
VRIAIIDSSCLINLTHLGLATAVSHFFQLVLIPSSVHNEVKDKHRFRRKLKKLYDTGLYQKCVVADPVSVELLLKESGIQRGEAEALAQAQEHSVGFLIMDEKRARQIAGRRGVKPIGTARIVARLHLMGLADEPTRLMRMLQRDKLCRMAPEIVEQAIQLAEEPF